MKHPLGPGPWRITQQFGERPEVYAPLGYAGGHEGVDFAAVVGAPVYASHDGILRWMPYSPGYGRYCRVESVACDTTYAHLSAYAAPGGVVVKAGQCIALSGDTGNVTGPHLHFGVRPKPTDWQNGFKGYVDPLPLIEEEGRVSKLGVQVQSCNELRGAGSWVIDHVREGGMTHALLIDPDVLTADPWPGVQTMGRLWFHGGPDLQMIQRGAAGAREYWNLCVPRWDRCPWIRLWHGPCEPFTGDPNNGAVPSANDLDPMRRITEFYVELARLMKQRGLQCGGPVFSTGVPAGPEANPLPTIEAKWRIFGPACNVLDALVLHEYGMETLLDTEKNRWHVGAYKRGVAALRAAGYRVPPIWITEHGIDLGGGPTTDGWRVKLNGNEAEYMRQLAMRDAEYSADPLVTCVLPFLWLDYNWPSFTIIKSMSQRIVAHRKAQGGALDLERAMWEVLDRRIIPLNPSAALEKAAAAKGLLPASDEVRDLPGYVCQAFRDAARRDRKYGAICKDGDWGNITWYERKN